MNETIKKFENSKVIPVLTLNETNEALKIADSLLEGGLINLEVTLRTKNALKCIEAIKREFPNAHVGAGTIVYKHQLDDVKNAGGEFAVSPGFTATLVKKAKEIGLFYLPGASTPSEIIELSELDIKFQKFFHASNSGGYKMLKAYSSIFGDIKFCPTGGIGAKDYKDYLGLSNVLCVGGSWMVDMKNLDYQNIKNSAKALTNSIENR